MARTASIPGRRIARGERRILVLLGGGLFLILFAASLGQNAGLSILLERHGAAYLPQMYVANALALVVLSSVTMGLMSMFPLRPVMVVTFGAGAVVVFFLRQAHVQGLGWAPGALYVAGFASADILATLFWSVANRAYNTRDAKSLFPIVGAAGTLGASVSGFFARWVIPRVGITGLLVIWAAALLACAVWSIVAAAVLPGMSSGEESTASEMAVSPAEVRPNRTLRWALATGLVFVVAVTLLGRYLYGTALQQAYAGDEALAATNGLLIGIGNAVTFLVQMVLMSRILSRFGVRVSGLIYPVAMLAAFAALYIHFSLPVAIACFFGITTIRQGVQGVVENVLYTPMPPREAARSMVLTTAIGMPAGMVLAGLVLGMFAGSPPEAAAALGMLAATALVVAAVFRASAYKAALRAQLLKGGSDLRARFSRLPDDSNATVELVLSEGLSPHSPDLLNRLKMLARSRTSRNTDKAAQSRPRWDESGALGLIVESRIREAYRLHATLEALPDVDRVDDVPAPVMKLLCGAVHNRLQDNLDIILAALRAGMRQPVLDRVSLRLLDADRRVRAAAVEILDEILPECLRSLVLPLLEERRLPDGVAAASARYERDREEALANPIAALLDFPDDWIRAAAAYAVAHLDPRPHISLLHEFSLSPDSFLSFSASYALGKA